MTKVKICGITNLDDALLCAKFGADALGFNFYDKSPRYIAPGSVKEIDRTLRERFEVLTVGVFVDEPIERVLRIAIDSNVDVIQLHGNESPAYFERIIELSGLSVIKAFRVTNDLTLGHLGQFAIKEDRDNFEMDGMLLDADAHGVYGGSGEVADWDFARNASDQFNRIYLAGGLNKDNIDTAIKAVRPFGVDAASGVEARKGKKDPQKLEAFIKNAKNA